MVQRAHAIAVVVLTAPANSAASDDKPVAPFVAAHLGAGAPQGRFGGALGVTLSGWARLEMRAGQASEGRQFAAFASGVYRGFGLGLGYSLGPYRWDEIRRIECDDFCDARHWRSAKWLNAELSYRYEVGWHIFMGPYLGFSQMLNPRHHTCPPTEGGCGENGDGERRLYVGLMLGAE